jgi:hypothetical protein
VSSSLEESVLTIQDTAQNQKDNIRKAIDDAVNKALLGESIVDNSNATNQNTSDSTLGSQIKDSLQESKINESLSIEIKEVISSNKIRLIYKGEEKVVRLIGVGPNGRKEHLQYLIDNMTNEIHLEFDTKKKDGEYLLVYLWDGEPSEVKNMINIQMIKNEYATCTYNAGSTIIEQPNIKYFGDFIDATK